MKRWIVALPAIGTLLFGALPAMAGTYADQVAATLKSSAVFVAPGTPNTTTSTASELAQSLTSGDNIKLVELPANAPIGGSPTDFAAQLGHDVGSTQIVGITIGDNLVVYAPSLPSAEVQTLETVSVTPGDPVTTLRTFTHSVHEYVASNPQAVVKPSIKPAHHASSSGAMLLVILLVSVGIICIVAGIVATERKRRRNNSETRKHS